MKETAQPSLAATQRRALARWGAALRTPMGALAGSFFAIVLLLALIAPMVWGDRAGTIDTAALSEGPSARHWFGTDSLGRDILYRTLVATRLSVQLALVATGIAVGVGILLGAAPWLLGRVLGRVATAAVNVSVAFSGLLLVLFFTVIFGVGVRGAVLGLGLAAAPHFARLTQTLVAGVQHRDFVDAARVAGVGRMRMLVRHILPNIGEPLVVNATLGAGGALLAFAGLSFLGLGVQAPSYDWGLLLSEGLAGIYVRPSAAIAPGVAIVAAGLAFNLFGEVVAKQIGLRTARVLTDDAYTAHRVSSTTAPRAVPGDAGSEFERDDTNPVLIVESLQVTVPGAAGPVTPVRQVNFTISSGEAVGLVGESGSGKSLTALAVARLIEGPLGVQAERLDFLGTDLLRSGSRETNRLLGNSLGVIFQDPMTSLNPTMRVGPQMAEGAQLHQDLSRERALALAVDRLRAMRVPAPPRCARQYPHELSGGMRQRAMLGMAMMGDPALIIADEPTTALDVTVQRQVLRLLQEVRVARNVAVLLISHDITVVGQVCDRVLVMYAGRIVEDLPAAELRTNAHHPYTRMLLAAVPTMASDRDRPLTTIPGRTVDPSDVPPGCAFAPRCPLADERCRGDDPPLTAGANGRRVACWHAGEPLPDSAAASKGAAAVADSSATCDVRVGPSA